MSDLKPCPFCGGVVNWCVCGNCPRITCPKCGQFDLVKAGETLEGAKQEAETTWNNRPFEQRLAAAESKIPKWIPVSEALPPYFESVLAIRENCTGRPYYATMYLDEKWFDIVSTEVIDVTHWMPLPDAPETERKGK